MKATYKKRIGTAGRTLIELVTALAIAGITGLALSQIGVLGFTLEQTSLYEDERVYPVRNAFDRVAQDLRMALAIIPDCGGVSGRHAIATLGSGGTLGIILTYERDAENRLVQKSWTDAGCTTVQSSSILAYQITNFVITSPVPSDRSIELLLSATAADGTSFTLQERITGRGF
jgi:type II secretory pathway component PulJ